MLAVLRYVPFILLWYSSSSFIVFHGSIIGNPVFPLPLTVMLDLFEDRDFMITGISSSLNDEGLCLLFRMVHQ